MYCPECGKLVSDSAKFCEACGKAIVRKSKEEADSPSTLEIAAPRIEHETPTFAKTRLMNWAIACLLAAGAATVFLKANQTATAFAILSAVLVQAVGIPALTAIALSPDGAIFFGMPICVSGKRRKLLQKVTLVGNSILGLFGLLGLVACVATGQYLPMLPVLVYVLPPFINVLMLRRATGQLQVV